MKKSTNVRRNDVWELFEINRDKPLTDHLSGARKTLLGHLCLDTLLANLFLGALLGNTCLVTSFGNLLLETCSWKPVLGKLSLRFSQRFPSKVPKLGSQARFPNKDPRQGSQGSQARFPTVSKNRFPSKQGSQRFPGRGSQAGFPSQVPNPDFGCSDLLRDLTMAEDPKLTLLGNYFVLFQDR